ncbi:unnamed protein product [Ciceribacter selenitireducens ATCC BAA-1503]|uniref:Uncharacterized protein n=1 Tax=Ciceribacter selenitireducens ATCC BAA-1503 TaxID=1336235 RepID=A0A376AKP4_9HYPH|nr:unnamed protein product [Ciceribacter selenitireducens ATCC BAA-1503]
MTRRRSSLSRPCFPSTFAAWSDRTPVVKNDSSIYRKLQSSTNLHQVASRCREEKNQLPS